MSHLLIHDHHINVGVTFWVSKTFLSRNIVQSSLNTTDHFLHANTSHYERSVSILPQFGRPKNIWLNSVTLDLLFLFPFVRKALNVSRCNGRLIHTHTWPVIQVEHLTFSFSTASVAKMNESTDILQVGGLPLLGAHDILFVIFAAAVYSLEAVFSVLSLKIYR